MSTEHIRMPAIPPRIQYIADGSQTAFAFPFAVFAETDLEVHLDAAPQASGFAVAGVGVTAGGTVTFATAPAAGTAVTLARRLPLQRVTDFLESGPLSARALNDQFDYLTACLQQVADGLERVLRYADADLPAATLLPARAERANKLLGFDEAGNPSVTPTADAEALGTFVPPGAGAVTRRIRDKIVEIASVRDYGALGDGVADDTQAIQAALAAVPSVFLPAGTYRISGPIEIGEGRTLFGGGASSVLRTTGNGFDAVVMPAGYATLREVRIEGELAGVRLFGRDGPCVQNAVHDVAIWDADHGLVLDGHASTDRPCYWNNFDRVLVARPRVHGVWLTRTGAGDTPNANRFHVVRVYSLGAPLTGSGIYVEHGRYNNAFVDCEANVWHEAHSCVRIGADTDKTLMVNLYTETVGAVANVVLDAGSRETAIVNLFSASAGPAIWDLSGGQYTAVNAGYPEKNRLMPTRITELTVEALRYDTAFYDAPGAGVYELDLAGAVYFISAFNGAVEARLPPASAANGHAVTIKKTDSTANPVTVTEDGGAGPDGRTVALGNRYDFVTVVSNGANWWITAANLTPGHARFVEGVALVEPDLNQTLYLVSGFAGAVEVRLPLPYAAHAVGRTVTVKKSDASANAVTVTQDGGGGPDGAAVTLGGQGEAVTVLSNGAAWHVLSRNP